MNPYQHHTDAELIALLIEGNEKAFAVIYQRYASDLYRYARKNIQEGEDCREIIQDVFESLWVRRSDLKHVTVLKAYLFQMVKYKIIRYCQHNAVKKKYEDHFKFFESAYETVDIEERDSEAINANIQRCLADLSERCQYAVNLRLKENLSNGEIAKRMNIKKRTVENYMAMALAHLKAVYPKLSKAG